MSLGVVQTEEKEDGKKPLWMHKHLLSGCAMYVCNKWDLVPDKEIKHFKNYVIKKLTSWWPGLDPETQIIHMSTTKANTAQKHGFITEDFSSLINGIRSMVLNSIDSKLELHWG